MESSIIRCLITAGPTREYLDPVRYMSNPSSGKMGFALAAAGVSAGWQVDLVSGPVTLQVPNGVKLHKVVTGDDMYRACKPLFRNCDILIMCAAVCDMRPANFSEKKVKKENMSLRVNFERTVDILKTLSQQRTDMQVLVGFAAETEDVEAHAMEKLHHKKLDWIVANSVAQGGAFEADDNYVTLLGKDGYKKCIGPANKIAMADELIAILADKLN